MRIYTFSELKESKLIFDKKAPPFSVIITLITLIFVTAIIIIAAFSVKTYVVKASSVVTSENKSYIMNGVSGSVKEIYVEEGDQVDEAAPLFSLDTTEVDLQIKQLQEMLISMAILRNGALRKHLREKFFIIMIYLI